MKPYLSIAAALVVVLNGLLLIPAMNAYAFSIAALALLLAVAVLTLSLLGPKETPAPPPTPVAAKPPPPPPPEKQAEAEVVAFLGLLQEKGRFVDFLMDDVALYDDSRVGAVARVVHYGCRDVLHEHFKVTPISSADEGSQVTVPEGYAADEYRLMGKITGNPPFKGVLLHKGWKTDFVKLPRIIKTGEKHLPSIAPALVEVK